MIYKLLLSAALVTSSYACSGYHADPLGPKRTDTSESSPALFNPVTAYGFPFEPPANYEADEECWATQLPTPRVPNYTPEAEAVHAVPAPASPLRPRRSSSALVRVDSNALAARVQELGRLPSMIESEKDSEATPVTLSEYIQGSDQDVRRGRLRGYYATLWDAYQRMHRASWVMGGSFERLVNIEERFTHLFDSQFPDNDEITVVSDSVQLSGLFAVLTQTYDECTQMQAATRALRDNLQEVLRLAPDSSFTLRKGDEIVPSGK